MVRLAELFSAQAQAVNGVEEHCGRLSEQLAAAGLVQAGIQHDVDRSKGELSRVSASVSSVAWELTSGLEKLNANTLSRTEGQRLHAEVLSAIQAVSGDQKQLAQAIEKVRAEIEQRTERLPEQLAACRSELDSLQAKSGTATESTRRLLLAALALQVLVLLAFVGSAVVR